MEFLTIIEFLGKCEEISFFLREESFTILIQYSTLNFSHEIPSHELLQGRK